jgi:hypothetical protein
MGITNRFVGVFLSAILSMAAASVSFANTPITLEEMLRDGKITTEVGSYFEQTNSKQADKDFGWANAYISLKYETMERKRVKAGVGFFAHSQLYSRSEDGTDPFNTDVEKEYTVPEVYLNWGFTEKSNVTLGRWNHKKVTHIDDAQSEGAYVNIKEIPDLELIAGFMTRFAEIDYDDSEDFGRTNDAQDLNSEATYGPGAEPYLLFLDPRYKVNDMLNLNPFAYYQHGYAGVYGLDTKVKHELKSSGITYGSDFNYYHVVSDRSTQGDADVWMIAPNIAKGPISIRMGVLNLDGGNSFNRPDWFAEYYAELDQTRPYGSNADMELYFGRIKYSKDKFWTQLAYGDYSYDWKSTQGNGSKEMEWLTGYKFTKNLSADIRLFNVLYDDVVDRDYKKVETFVRYTF